MSFRPDTSSRANWIASLPPETRSRFLSQLSDAEAVALAHDWTFWARPSQLSPDGEWSVWVLNAGRGFGKTRAGAEWVRAEVESGRRSHVALIAKTPKDARDVMIEGESGLLAIASPWCKPHYEPSKARVTYPNGARATIYSAEEPDQLRGPQHDGFWGDELAKWKYPQDTWDNLMLGLRMGDHPRGVVTTTPRPIPLLKRLLKAESTVVTGGSTYENAANLAPQFLAEIRRQYEGTRLGRQELHAELLSDVPGALWTQEQLDALRVRREPVSLVRIVVAIDPSGSDDPEADEVGIVVAGLGVDGHGYVMEDESDHYTPGEWGSTAVRLYRDFGADRILGEVNFGGQMVEHTVRMAAKDAGCEVAYKAVTASRGKLVRAEPVSALYEQGRCHHVGLFAQLEDEMATWVPGMRSPNRMDALVWAFTELIVQGQDEIRVWGGAIPTIEPVKAGMPQPRVDPAITQALETDGIYWPGGDH